MKRIILLFICIIFFIYSDTHATGEYIDSRVMNEEHISMTRGTRLVVTDSGDIFIGFKDKHINYYDGNGDFVRSFLFKTSGSYFFDVEGDMLIIGDVRAKGFSYYEFDGDFSYYTEYGEEEFDEFYNRSKVLEEVRYDGDTYNLVNDKFRTYLIRGIDIEEGTIIYDSGSYLIKPILIFIFLSLFVFVIVYAILHEFKKIRNRSV